MVFIRYCTMAQDPEITALCPKCRIKMIFVTTLPHPKAPEMQRTTFVCYGCNQTRSYSLSPAMAQAYELAASEAQEEASATERPGDCNHGYGDAGGEAKALENG